MILQITACNEESDNQLKIDKEQQSRDFVNIKGDLIIDSNFKNIPDHTITANRNENITNNWTIKTTSQNIQTEILKINEGMLLNTEFEEYGYVYIRQIIRNILKFENKKIELEVVYELLDNNINFDIYIQSRFNRDSADRILVVDTQTMNFKEDIGILKYRFNVPDFNNKKPDSKIEGLSVAFRLVGKKGISNSIIIKKMSLKIIDGTR